MLGCMYLITGVMTKYTVEIYPSQQWDFPEVCTYSACTLFSIFRFSLTDAFFSVFSVGTL